MTYSNCIQAIGNTRFVEGEAWIIPMRLVWPDGSYFDTSTTGTDGIVDIDVAVYDLDAPANPQVAIYIPTLSVANPTLFASLQTDGYWTVDNVGYNARPTFAVGFAETSGGHRYAVELTFNPHASNVYGQKIARFQVDVDSAIRT